MRKTLFLCLAGMITLAACQKDDNNSGAKTPVSVRITDAPGLYDAVNLNVNEVQFLTTGGRSTISVQDPQPFDILQFSMGRDTLLANDLVSSGTLQEVRLVLADEGNTVTVDGNTYPLTTPSGQSSGVKLKIHDELVPNVAYVLLLDFDVASSITTTGNGKYILKPVIRAIPEAVSGTIKGQVLPVEAGAKVFAEFGEERIGAITNENGEFYFPGIEAGTYRIVIEPTDSQYATKVIEDVVVENGVAKDLGQITLDLRVE